MRAAAEISYEVYPDDASAVITDDLLRRLDCIREAVDSNRALTVKVMLDLEEK